ncbi:MAG: hypothetical protein HC844_17760 [Tabrizicola sp.]|nr:hypothetical protein [Tabrizicola sp.]
MTIRQFIRLSLASLLLFAANPGAAESSPAQADIALAEKSIAKNPENHQN